MNETIMCMGGNQTNTAAIAIHSSFEVMAI